MKRIPALVTLVCAVRSAAFAQTSLNISQDLVSLGIASTNMVPNQPTLDAGPLFFRAVLYAQNHQIGRVIANPGAYYFQSLQYSGAHVAWDQLDDLTIDLQGSDLYFAHPLVQGLLITHATNIVVQNFTMDYDPLPFTQVRVLSVDPTRQQIQYAVDGNWQNPSVLNAVFPVVPNAYGFGIEVHMFRNGRPIPGVTRMYATNPVSSAQFTATPDPGVNPSALFAQIRPGDVAFLGMRAGSGPFSVLYCTGCTFRNIAVYSGTQWGFLAAHMQSSVFERVYSEPRPGTDRLAGNYVGLLLTDVGPSNEVRLNRAIRSMDDAIEYDASFLGTVKSQTDSRTLVLEGSITTKLSYGDSVPNGSVVAFQRLSDGAIVASAAIASQVAPQYTGQQPYDVTFTFDRDLPSSIVGALMLGTDPSQRGGNSVLERNALEDETDCCTGFLVAGLINSVFRGNYILRSGMTGLHTENSLQQGNFDLPPNGAFTVSDNVIDGANWARTSYPLLQLGSIQIDSTNSPRIVTASPNQDISITGNFIADGGSAAVWLGNTTGGSVSGNYFLNPDTNPAVVSAVSFFGPTQPLVVQSSQNIATSNNTADQTSGRVWVTDGQYRELAAYAPGSVIRLNAYGVGSLVPTPSITLTDADGNTTPLTIQNASSHAIDVQIPAMAGFGGAYLTLTSGGAKYFGTLFLDAVDNIPAVNGCTYEASPSSASVEGGYTSLPVLVVTQAGCSYQVLTTDSFVNGGPGARGPGVITVGVTANSGAARTTTVEIAGQLFTVTQVTPSGSLASRFVPITPCRAADTRSANGPFGGPAITGGTSRSFVVPNSACGIPGNATAYSMNVAVVPRGTLGFLTLWPSGQAQPLVATLNSLDGRVKSNAGIVPAGSNGAVSVFATDTTDVVLDINGYFEPPGNSAALAFYPLTPCRIADTRNASGPLGGPSLPAQSTRTFPILGSSCGLPANAQAYSLNFAAVPKGALGFLTAWPAGQPLPLAASLNDVTGTIAANAVIVPAGANGAVNVFASDATDLVIDVSGYFAPPGPGGLSLYAVTPCRVLDTRLTSGTPFSTTLDVNVIAAPCGVPATARAFLFNATAIPSDLLGYLTMWPQGQPQPLAATLNAYDGALTNNMAIVPTANGSVSIFPSDATQLVLDAFGFFAP
jgi:hypothetical protein